MAASVYRAGAQIYLTYYAEELARFMDEGRIAKSGKERWQWEDQKN